MGLSAQQLSQPLRLGHLRGDPRRLLRCLERPHGQIRGHHLNWNERMGTGQNLGRLVLLIAPGTAALDYDSTLIGALELSSKKWVFAVQLPGAKKHSRHVVDPNGPALAELIERLKARSGVAGKPIARVIITHEAGRDGFWLARFLARRGVEVHVMQSSS